MGGGVLGCSGGGSEGALGSPAWPGFQSLLGIWIFGPELGVCFCIIGFLENMVWGTSHLWEICGFICRQAPLGKGLRSFKNVEKQSMLVVLGTQQPAVSVGRERGLSGYHGEEFQG